MSEEENHRLYTSFFFKFGHSLCNRVQIFVNLIVGSQEESLTRIFKEMQKALDEKLVSFLFSFFPFSCT